ncbi:MAG: RHS repeat-associated core domain-containing protein [Pyrinomonadaceae bacterium]
MSGAEGVKAGGVERRGVFIIDPSLGDGAYSTAAPPANPTTSYLTTDHLGSPRVITDSTGNVTSRRDFMPFGEDLGAGVGPRTTGLKYSGTDNVRQRFTGYEKDTESGLDFAEARMYENKHGRFTAVDPLMASASAGDPQTFNRYTYTGNNPINYTDPSGLCVDRATGKDDGKPCPDQKGEVFVKDGVFWIGPVDGGTRYTGGPQRVNNYGVSYDVSSDGWRQVSPDDPIGSQSAANEEVQLPRHSVLANDTSERPLQDLPAAPEPMPIGVGGELDKENAEGSRVVEGAARLAEGCSFIPGLGTPCGIIGASARAGQGRGWDAGNNLVNAIPFVKWLRKADAAVDVAKGSHVVYQGVDRVTGAVKYIGITSRGVAIRAEEHLRAVGTGKELLRYGVIKGYEGLTKLDARIIEQTLINKRGLDNLLNKRNEIAKRFWRLHGIE